MVASAGAAVRELRLDVLVFGDVFMDSATAHLAMQRLAPIQVCLHVCV